MSTCTNVLSTPIPVNPSFIASLTIQCLSAAVVILMCCYTLCMSTGHSLCCLNRMISWMSKAACNNKSKVTGKTQSVKLSRNSGSIRFSPVSWQSNSDNWKTLSFFINDFSFYDFIVVHVNRADTSNIDLYSVTTTILHYFLLKSTYRQHTVHN